MKEREFSPGDAGAVLFTILGLVGLATMSVPALLLPLGIGLGVRQVLRARRETREIRAASADRRPDGWFERLNEPAPPTTEDPAP